ncbi:DUF932 domain-containing protein [Salinicola lusitanus]|uniref:DUF932 domain-containing protein n=1 Tax=Salinicola lusitanus TaxID=1949085 RepID=A0ABZ3CWX1_9GAMM
MAHELETMAYVGDTPWHGLGNRLSPAQPLEVWRREAGLDWRIQEAPVRYVDGEEERLGTIHAFPEQKVLYRSDTRAPLSVVSQRYRVVQPEEILEFYRDLTEHAGYELETAGVLKGGRKFWALARSGLTTSLKGVDAIGDYLLLATSCDGSLATVATPTTVRVVCNNTLSIAVDGASQSVKVPHSTRFDARQVKRQLGISVSRWDDFMVRLKTLAERRVTQREAEGWFQSVLCDISTPISDTATLSNRRALERVTALYNGKGRGSELCTARNTAWGLVNAVTEYVDHEKRARSNDYRMDSAWFGQGAQLKQKALNAALELVT